MPAKRASLRGQITVYSISGCPFCAEAKSTLKEQGLPFVEVSVDKYPVRVRDWLHRRTLQMSVPQIFFNERHVGGNDDLQELVADGKKFRKVVDHVKRHRMPSDPETAPMVPYPTEAVDESALEGGQLADCEKDDLAPFVAGMTGGGVLRTHCTNGRGGKSFCVRDSFTGRDFVRWCTDERRMSHGDAVAMGKELVSRRFGVNVDGEGSFRESRGALYKLATSDRARALNTDVMSECVQRPPGEVAEDMRKVTLKLFSDFLTPSGKGVDYDGISKSEEFGTYKRLTLELQRVDLEALSREEKLALFINVYNVLVIHGMVEKGVPSSLYRRYKFFSTTAYNIGGRVFSLNDIENGILRSNRASMATLYMKPFGSSDPRREVVLPECEPRIHFALNCGAKSCPSIKTFSKDDIDNELDFATRAFLETDDALKVDEGGDKSESTIRLSMLFKWCAQDFGDSNDQVLGWIYSHLCDHLDKKHELGEILKRANKKKDSKAYKIKYIKYDWGHNAKGK